MGKKVSHPEKGRGKGSSLREQWPPLGGQERDGCESAPVPSIVAPLSTDYNAGVFLLQQMEKRLGRIIEQKLQSLEPTVTMDEVLTFPSPKRLPSVVEKGNGVEGNEGGTGGEVEPSARPLPP